MTKRSPLPVRSTGRLPIGRDPVIPVRIPLELLAAIDKWAASEGSGGRMNRYAKSGVRAKSRSDAIRKLIIKGLGNVGQRVASKVEDQRRGRRAEAFLDRREGMREALEALKLRRKITSSTGKYR